MNTPIASADLASTPLEISARAKVCDRRLELASLSAILLLALVLRLWGLEQNGWGAEYYSAAVRSMSLNWHNFFYAAFDPQGFISVDKPPVALWLQVASVKLFGFQPFSLILPQLLEGVLSVGLLFHLVRRRFDVLASLLAALFLALTPILVAVNRTNNMDSCLLLILLLASWAFIKALEEGSRRNLLLSMLAIGVAFNVKMLAALIVLPVFFLIYLAAAPVDWRRRVFDLTLASVVLVACALPWVLAVELTPAESRPWVGSSSRNSMFELLVGHNGAGRFVSRIKSAGPAANPTAVAAAVSAENAAAGDTRLRSVVPRIFVRAPTGPMRLADGQLAAQFAWLLPLAITALVLGGFHFGRRSRARTLTASDVRSGQTQDTSHARQLALLFWSSWLLIYATVYSYTGGIMHFYYLSTMAPALAALAGIGASGLWQAYRECAWQAYLLPAALLITACWQIQVQLSGLGMSIESMRGPSGDWLLWPHLMLIGGTLLAVFVLLLCKFQAQEKNSARDETGNRLAAGALTCGIAALLVLPTAWSLSSVLVAGHGILPSADLYRLDPAVRSADERIRGRFGQSADSSRLLAFLQHNQPDELYLLSTSTAQLAAPLIIASGEPVMARGGYHGLDAAITVQQFARMVADKEVRFATLGDLNIVNRRMGAEASGKPIADWIRSKGKLVPAHLWQGRGIARDIELYDLRPEAGWFLPP
ncbi:glycosyltransferase family 39 protein [soil metagenome]